MADTDSLDKPLRMSAYYYSFNRTGVLAVDRVLSAVATAGKHYHHTESWGDWDDATSETGRIQAAADEAAAELRGLRSQLAESQQENERLRETQDRHELWCNFYVTGNCVCDS